eukprot:1873710-Amphidinium_carterae.1
MRDYLERALRIEERHYGPEHPVVAQTLNNLAAASANLGDLPSAHEQVKCALRIFEASSLGAEHPHALVVKRHLANIEMNQHLQEMLGRERLKLEDSDE